MSPPSSVVHIIELKFFQIFCGTFEENHSEKAFKYD